LLLQKCLAKKTNPYIAALSSEATDKMKQHKPILQAEPNASDPAQRTGFFKI